MSYEPTQADTALLPDLFKVERAGTDAVLVQRHKYDDREHWQGKRYHERELLHIDADFTAYDSGEPPKGAE